MPLYHQPPKWLFLLERHKKAQSAKARPIWDAMVAANPALAQIKLGCFYTDAVFAAPDSAYAAQVRDDYIFAQTGK